MIRKVETITERNPRSFDEDIGEFLARDYVSVEHISYSTTAMAWNDRVEIIYVAHIDYIDVRQREG